MIRTFEMQRKSGTKIQGVVFEDGSLAVRLLNEDPCSRITFTFEGVSECEAELEIKVPPAEPPSRRYRAEDNEPEDLG